MDAQQAKYFKERWLSVAAVEREEQRMALIEQRWRQLNAILQLAAGLGLLVPEEETDDVYRRWARLKGEPV